MSVSSGATLNSPFGDAGVASRAVHWVLRLSVWACFVGHGMFGLRQKTEWLIFFEPWSIPEPVAMAIMPLVGLVDVTLGYLVLLRPTRVILMYTAFWGIFTGLLRPLAGMTFFETIERAGNYGPSLALLLGTAGAAVLSRVPVYDLAVDRHYDRMKTVLVLTTSLLLVGHGALSLNAKPLLVGHWEYLELSAGMTRTTALVRALGVLEIGAGLLLVVWPTRLLCIAILSWKLFTEMLFVVSGAPFWEVVERGGSFGAPLALFIVLSFGAAWARRVTDRGHEAAAVRTAAPLIR